jgi:hypothetical protein
MAKPKDRTAWGGAGGAALTILLYALKVSGKNSRATIAILLFAVATLFLYAAWNMPWMSQGKRRHSKVLRGIFMIVFVCTSLSIFGYWIWPESSEVKSLCPRPLNFSLKQVPLPSSAHADNYATEVTIDAVREPMYHVHVFTRTLFSGLNLTESPQQGISATETRQWEHYSFFVTSTHGATEYKVVVYTPEALRLVCVNQDN